ncbi:hypothetical protein DFQ30_010717 [Apophysomyces sp. BC1015]|nr:hypothetical protein DFQ30_010717 [Apophysomyces sp. BC1015]
MQQHFLNKYCMIKEPKLPKSVHAAWGQVVHLCEERNEVEARSFVAKELDKHRDEEVIIGLETIQQLLIAFRRYHQLLDPFRISPPPEYDLAFKLWLQDILDRLLKTVVEKDAAVNTKGHFI